MAKAKGKSGAKAGKNEVSTERMSERTGDSGGGFEGTGGDDYAIPFIAILQKMSPAVDKDDSRYVQGAEAGMFMNSVTTELTKDIIRVVPCARLREYVEWIDRDAGGGIAARYNQDDPVLGNMNRDGIKMTNPENGNSIMDTRYHYCILLKEDGTHEQVVLSMASSQIKASKNWMTRMRSWMVAGPNGPFNPPMYGQTWTLGLVRQQNDDGSWYGFAIVGEPELVSDPDLYNMAKGFGAMADAQEVRLAQEPGADGGGGAGPNEEDEIPF